jgi:lipopolysaccharide/colanic/teichoic acid biosynthesis glycosyltransferase
MSEYSLAKAIVGSGYGPGVEAYRGPAGSDDDQSLEAIARRALDLILAVAGLIFLAPLLLTVAVLIKLQDRGPILFQQERLGRAGRVFQCWKFRTMVVDAQARLDDLLERDPEALQEWQRDHKLKDDPRITGLGRFLRKSSIDEIPQLLNIIAGEMSIVGPRPIVRAEIPRYAGRFASYCRVKPGLTGLWQISGRSNTSYRRRVAMDVLYIKRRTLMMDIRIIAFTIPAVLQSRGSY